MGGVAVLLAAIGVCDVLFGPTASCSLRTAVQVEQLSALNRVRRAQKVLEIVKPLITAAQGSLSPEEVAAQMQARSIAPMASASVVQPAPTSIVSPAAVGDIPPKIVP